MSTNEDRVHRFQEALKDAYGEEITEAEASEMLARLRAFYRVVSQPLPSEPKDETEEDRQIGF
jgi:hypothetical protein